MVNVGNKLTCSPSQPQRLGVQLEWWQNLHNGSAGIVSDRMFDLRTTAQSKVVRVVV